MQQLYKQYIESNKNSIEFFLSTQIRSRTKSSWLSLIILQFYHSFLFSVLYSGHKIFSLLHILSFTTVSFYLHFMHLTLLPLPISALLFLYFHALRQLLYHTLLNCSLETNFCSQFSTIFVLLYSYSPYSTNVITCHMMENTHLII